MPRCAARGATWDSQDEGPGPPVARYLLALLVQLYCGPPHSPMCSATLGGTRRGPASSRRLVLRFSTGRWWLFTSCRGAYPRLLVSSAALCSTGGNVGLQAEGPEPPVARYLLALLVQPYCAPPLLPVCSAKLSGMGGGAGLRAGRLGRLSCGALPRFWPDFTTCCPVCLWAVPR